MTAFETFRDEAQARSRANHPANGGRFYWYWTCEAGCGQQSWGTYATQADAHKARLQHEKECPSCLDRP